MQPPDYGKEVGVGRPTRIVLGVVIMLAAGLSALLGAYMIGTGLSHVPLKYRDVLGGVLFFCVFGVFFGYVAFRLMILGDGAQLFGRTGSLVAAVFLMSIGLFVLVLSVLTRDVSHALAAVVVLPAAAWLWRTALKRGKHEP